MYKSVEYKEREKKKYNKSLIEVRMGGGERDFIIKIQSDPNEDRSRRDAGPVQGGAPDISQQLHGLSRFITGYHWGKRA